MMRFYLLFVLLLIVPPTYFAPASAQTSYADIERCERAIPVPVPAFSCLDGVVVPKVFNAQGHCEYPEDLNSRCVENSRLGRLNDPANKDVDIIFSCRNVQSGDVDNDAPVTFRDIAVIQHDRKTGATCFYQHLENTDGKNIPAPGKDTQLSFWNEPVDYCSQCHTNGAFVRTPHYWDVEDAAGMHVLPAKQLLPELEPYSIVNKTSYQVASISREGNACTACHQIGAYRTSPQSSWKIGGTNMLASGQWDNPWGPGSRGRMNGPMFDGYDDFMSKHVQGGRAGARKAITSLQECLKTPMPSDCTLTHTYTEPYSKKGAGDVRFQTRNFNMMGQGMDATLPHLVVVPTIALATIEYNHQCDSCGGAINQIIIGFEGESEARACIYSGGQSSGGWKTAVVDLSQPMGVVMQKRDIRVRYAQAFNCKDALGWWDISGTPGPDVNHTIGTLTIR